MADVVTKSGNRFVKDIIDGYQEGIGPAQFIDNCNSLEVMDITLLSKGNPCDSINEYPFQL